MSDLAAMIDAAQEAVLLAARVSRQVQSNLDAVRAITKDDRSPVTVADYACQAVVGAVLRERLGKIVLVGEEDSKALRDEAHATHLDAALAAVRAVFPEMDEGDLLSAIDVGTGDTEHAAFWTLDPIDGTKGFLRNQQYAIALAYIERGEVVIGAMGCPNLARDFAASFDEADPRGSLYVAVRGDGLFETWCDGDKVERGEVVRIRRPAHEEGDAVTVCESVEAAHSNQSDSAAIMARLGVAVNEPARLDSQCKYAVVARGQADAYLRMPTKKGYVERIWDHAAGSLVAQEAGCVVTDIACKALDFSCGRGLEKNRGVVVAPPRLHGKIIGAVQDLGLA